MFLGARFTPGFELIARQGGLARRLARADLVVTGEGAIDASTLMGKGVGQIAALCHKSNIPCIGLAGMAVRSPQLARRFAQLHALAEFASAEYAKANATSCLEKLAEDVAARWLAQFPAE